MRVGIATLPLLTNYGGILQNFALQQVLKKDPSSEDANRLMAETLEKNENYETSCYYWFVTSTLNPLDNSYVKSKANFSCISLEN